MYVCHETRQHMHVCPKHVISLPPDREAMHVAVHIVLRVEVSQNLSSQKLCKRYAR